MTLNVSHFAGIVAKTADQIAWYRSMTDGFDTVVSELRLVWQDAASQNAYTRFIRPHSEECEGLERQLVALGDFESQMQNLFALCESAGQSAVAQYETAVQAGSQTAAAAAECHSHFEQSLATARRSRDHADSSRRRLAYIV